MAKVLTEGEKRRNARLSRGVTAKQEADRLGIYTGLYCRMERNEAPFAPTSPCPDCDGEGKTTRYGFFDNEDPPEDVWCKRCDGSGFVPFIATEDEGEVPA